MILRINRRIININIIIIMDSKYKCIFISFKYIDMFS